MQLRGQRLSPRWVRSLPLYNLGTRDIVKVEQLPVKHDRLAKDAIDHLRAEFRRSYENKQTAHK